MVVDMETNTGIVAKTKSPSCIERDLNSLCMLLLQVEKCQIETADLRRSLNQFQSLASEYKAQVEMNLYSLRFRNW